MGKKDILSLTLKELEDEIISLGEKKFRARQIYEWIHLKRVSDFSQMSNISAQFRETLIQNFCIKNLINF